MPFYLSPTRLDLIREHQDLIVSIEAKLGPNENPILVVLDTLNRSLNGSESKDADMAAYIEPPTPSASISLPRHYRPPLRNRWRATARPYELNRRSRGAVGRQTRQRQPDHHHGRAYEGRPEGEVFVSTLAVVEVGTDDDGDKITSCVVKPSNKPPARTGKGAGLTDAVFNTFTLLKRAIEDEGQKPPASNHIQPGQKVVTMSLWREYHKTGAGHERDKSKKGAGQRRDKDGTNETVRKKRISREHTKS